jgi:DegV family protein with EDD domain
MKIVTDNACDIPAEKSRKLGIIKVPLSLSFNGVVYEDSNDVDPSFFYKQLREQPDLFPTTSQPSVGAFVKAYEELVQAGHEILSVHISSGLSGTYHTALAAAEIVRQRFPDCKIHLWDTKTLSVAEGWQVLAAYSMDKAGKSLDEIRQALGELRDNSKFFFTIDTLKYLIHGGRISHISGLIASLLNIRPIITVAPDGKYVDAGKFISFKRALNGMVPLIQKRFDAARHLRVQVVHGENFAGVDTIVGLLKEHFRCQIDPVVQGDVAAGAHVGDSIVGLAIGYLDDIQAV